MRYIQLRCLKLLRPSKNTGYTKKHFKDKPFKDKDPLISLKVISETKVLVYKDKRLVIPTENMQSKVVQWYHHYLQHPGESRLEETIVAIMWWRGMRPHMRNT